MDGHRNYEVTRRRTVHELIVVLAPNELVAERLAKAHSSRWRETESEEETIVSVKAL